MNRAEYTSIVEAMDKEIHPLKERLAMLQAERSQVMKEFYKDFPVKKWVPQ